ncbi:MAG: NAD(+) synthase [Oscillospiraceae bacterium]|nr:NAD(+) synthase [Oscillospiraceae bacterium]
MKDGFIKVASGTPDIKVADCEYNRAEITALIDKAHSRGVKILVLPELCVTGYTCQDLFFQQTLLDGALDSLEKIVKHSSGLDMLIAVGCPLKFRGELYNCAAILKDGKILGVVPKKFLPNYNEFYEKRHFTAAPDGEYDIEIFGEKVPFGLGLLFECRQIPELVFAAEVCEDLWAAEPPSISLALGGATVIANLSASNETIGKEAYRRELVNSQSARLLCGYVFASAGSGESTQDLVFSGHDIIAENGVILAESQLYSTGLIISEIDVMRLAGERRKNTSFTGGLRPGMRRIPFDIRVTETQLTRTVVRTPFVPYSSTETDKRCEDILAMQAHGLEKRIRHTNAKTLVIGISGGLDSTLALLVCVEAMKLLGRPASDILAVTMPCFGTTKRTRTNAERLCELLGTQLRVIDIAASVKQHFRDIGHDENNHNVVYENGQARERTKILMDLANAENGMVVGTGDLSELALGWATYNGDHISMYGVNASVPKTLVRHIVKYYAGTVENPELSEVLMSIFDTPVSPELLPADENGDIAQITEDLVGPYELHDFFLYNGIRWGFSPKKVFRLAQYAFAGSYDRETILKWLRTFYRRFFSQQFKRSCLPDGVKVGSVTLSPRGDWRMPSDACAALWLKELETL